LSSPAYPIAEGEDYASGWRRSPIRRCSRKSPRFPQQSAMPGGRRLSPPKLAPPRCRLLHPLPAASRASD
jgi:hypothetical protein